MHYLRPEIARRLIPADVPDPDKLPGLNSVASDLDRSRWEEIVTIVGACGGGGVIGTGLIDLTSGQVLALRDHIVDGEVTIFDSNAIVLYLAEKTGKFLPKQAADRGPMLSWLMFVASGIGPFTGQYVHFKTYAPEKIAYALNRYEFEALRHWGIVDAHLAKNKYMAGDTYTIVDMALWGWGRLVPNILGEQAAKFANVKRLVDEISARPAAQKAAALKDRYAFKTEMDEEAKRAMFPGNYRS